MTAASRVGLALAWGFGLAQMGGCPRALLAQRLDACATEMARTVSEMSILMDDSRSATTDAYFLVESKWEVEELRQEGIRELKRILEEILLSVERIRACYELDLASRGFAEWEFRVGLNRITEEANERARFNESGYQHSVDLAAKSGRWYPSP